MRAGELLDADRRVEAVRELRALAHAQVGRPVREPGHRPQTELEVVTPPVEDHLRIPRERIGVGRGDEDGARDGLGIGHAAERARAERRPRPRLDEQVADGGALHRDGCPRARPERLELLRCGPPLPLPVGEGDHDRPESPVRTPMDRLDEPGARRGVADPGATGVLAQQLTTPNAVAGPHAQPGLEARKVVRHERDPRDVRPDVDHLGRSAGDRDVEALPSSVQRHDVEDARAGRYRELPSISRRHPSSTGA